MPFTGSTCPTGHLRLQGRRKKDTPLRRLDPACTAGLKGVIPIRRVNQSRTAEWKRECEEPILIDLHSRPEVRCSERDALRRTMMPLGAPKIGERRGRTRCDEIGIFRFPRGPWLWHDRRDWNCVAAFIPLWHDCRDLNLVVAVTSEQNDLVSSLFYNPDSFVLSSPRSHSDRPLVVERSDSVLPIEIKLGDAKNGY